MKLTIEQSAKAKVVVLMPPPVEPGDAPIHMMPMMNTMVALLQQLMSDTLKPAVRAVAQQKNDFTQRDTTESSAKVLPSSR